MSNGHEQERQVVRWAGYLVHALGVVGLVVGILLTAVPVGAAGLVLLVVGTVWTVHVRSLDREDAQAAAAALAFQHRRPGGFDASFDDEPTPPRPAGGS